MRDWGAGVRALEAASAGSVHSRLDQAAGSENAAGWGLEGHGAGAAGHAWLAAEPQLLAEPRVLQGSLGCDPLAGVPLCQAVQQVHALPRHGLERAVVHWYIIRHD